ncbi:hypothetical protein WJ97_11885 [Burkholderia ubonensis]|uniref:hypothetical protein n=1 Tax=Burkholderia ubonensis TaxID=101571 RepID=UPI0007525982|nr:hypothetical protein [Burkholderia ubonensis]KVP96578.1 hypothetical protein WJ97_11885 [Burkholderia ubonensis]
MVKFAFSLAHYFSAMAYVRELKKLPLPAGYARVPGVYWTPNAAFVAELVRFLGARPVLEVFAGNGYLAALLADCGVRITATSLFAGHDSHERGVYYDVKELAAVDAVRLEGARHEVLLLSWPTVTPAALAAVEAWGPGRDVVFIGEVTDYAKGHLGGCATDEFFERMDFHTQFKSYKGNMLEAAQVGRARAKKTPQVAGLEFSVMPFDGTDTR